MGKRKACVRGRRTEIMKNFSKRSLYAILALSVVGGCRVDDGEPRQALLPAGAVPPRPVLGPGESNWRPRDAALAKGPDSILACPSIGTVDLNLTAPEILVATLLGGGPAAPTVSNIQFTGANIAAGTFAGGAEPIGFEEGVILSSGNVASVAGPNAFDDVTTNNGLPGDPDLDGLIPGFQTFDATVLEFDFECQGAATLSFRYVFSSDEYNEYVNTAFNDVFGFFVNGSNIALIPGTTTPVAINNVNCGNPFNPGGGTNCGSFRNNDLNDGGGAICTEMDGLTAVFTAEAAVQPGVNHIRLAVGDAGDQILDSNIFLERGSFTCNSPPVAQCQNVTVPADGTCSAGASIDNGSFDPDGDALTCVQSPAAPYGQGATNVTLTCTDPAGASSSCTGTVTVVDVTPPDLTCPADQSAECVAGGAVVNYPNATATDNCGPASASCAPPSGSTFGVGDNDVTCSSTDAAGNSSQCSFNVAVVDTTPPVVTSSGAGELWPPNHKYVTKTIADCGVEINDQCQGAIDLGSANPTITCVTSDEPENALGDGNTLGDMVIVDATTVMLRSERAGGSDGRVYRIHFNVTDAAGNVGAGACEVTVPHDQGGGDTAVDSGVQFTVGTCN
jgi:hypothetical protein